MPNEITTPKVLKETIKQVYESMKADNLLLEFDRRTVLRLIIEALSAEEVNALIAAGKTGNKKLFRKIMRQYHPDRNKDNPEAETSFKQASELQDFFINDADVNKKNFENPEVWPDSIKNIFQTAQQGGGGQQAQGDQKEASPEVVQNVGEFLKKTQEKYHKLYEQMQQVIKKFTEEPAAFFADEQFVNNLVSIAQALNEQKGEGLGVELKDGDLKGNIQRIIAGLEKIRKELLEALSRKATLSKQRPEKEEGGEQQKQLNENKELYEKAKALLKREKSFYDEVNKAVESYIKDDSDENIKKILTSFRKRKRFADFKENVEKVQDLMQAVEEQRKGAQTVINKFRAGKGLTSDGFKKDIEAVGNYTQAYEALQQAIPSEKQDSKPMPLVPAVIDKVDDKQPLTIIDKSGEDVLQITKQEADATYDIITAADKFVRIYELLFALIQKKISLDKMPLPKKIDLSKPPQQPRIDLTKVPFVKISLEKEPDDTGGNQGGGTPVTDDDDGSAAAFNTDEFKKWYYDGVVPGEKKESGDENKKEKSPLTEQEEGERALNDHREDFTKSFTRIPMLQIQSQIFTRLYNEIANLTDENWLKRFTLQDQNTGEADFEKDQVSQQIQEQQEGQVEFDENDIATFKEEYENCLTIAKALNALIKKLDKSSSGLETIGGSKIVDQSRKIAQALQNSLAKVSQTISEELDQYVGKGGKLTEAPEKSPEQARQDANKAKRKKRGEKVVSVHRAVVGDLREIDQAVRAAEGEGIDRDTILNAAERIKTQLDSIKKFFPSIAPFGKVVKDPDKMIKQLKIFAAGLVTDLEDFMDQLKSLTAVRGMNEQVEKRKYDTETIADFKQKIIKMSSKIQEYFDVKSDIPEVGKKKAPKVTNMEQAAAEGPGGDKAIEQGKAEPPERQKEEEQESKGLTTHSQTVTKLKSYENVLKDLYEDLSDLQGDIKEIQVIGGKAFTSALVVLLNKFPEAEEQVQEEVGAKLSSPLGAGFKVFGMTKEKIKIINDLIKIDKTGKLSLFMYALRNDKIGATVLKKRIDQKLKGFSFNLDFNEVKKFFTTNKEKEQEVKQEQLEKKLEKLIEHYMTHGM